MMTPKRQALLGAGFATLAGIFWAITVGESTLVASAVPPVEIVAIRYTVQLVLLALLVMPFQGTAMVRTSRPRLHLLRGASMVVMPIAFEVAVHRVGAAEMMSTIWLAPLFGVAFERFTADRVTSRAKGTIVLAVIATIGVLIAHEPAPFTSISGGLGIVVAAAAFGAFFTLTRVLRVERTSTGLFWTAACVALPALILLPFTWQPLTPRLAVGVAVMGVLWLLVLLAIDEALRRAPLRLMTPFFLSEVIWLRLLFRLPWTRGAIAGSFVVSACAAVALAVLLRGDAGMALIPDTATL
jgi:drug/metabolite transporter (DMT)-like permease